MNGVLIGGPFVEDADRPIFQPRAEQGQPPPLALREVERREHAPSHRDCRCQTQSFEPVASPRLESGRAEAEKVRKEMAVGEDDRKELTIGFAILVVDRAAVEPDTSARRGVEARDQLDQGRLAAAVSPGQDDDLAGAERQVDGPEREARVDRARSR